MNPRVLTASVLAACLLAVACGRPLHPWEYRPRPLADTLPIHEPEEVGTSLAYEQLSASFSELGRTVAPARKSRLPPALNADPCDEVVDSSWFTNRNAREPLSSAAILRGSRRGDGPDQSGPVTVTSIKTTGVSPGFNIEDASGDTYILKFDTPEEWEMESGAEVVTTNLLWAAGYHVPENYVFHLDPSKLVLDEELELVAVRGDTAAVYRAGADDPARELTMEIFRRHALADYPRNPDGSIRAMASKFLEGIPKGPFAFHGTREDDPNDVIPHQHRRELRGLYVVAAWLNHVDSKEGNNLDMFVVDPRSPEGEGPPKIGHLRHHLIDFGSALGSRQDPRNGMENDFDLGAGTLRLVTLGLYERPWQDMDESPGTPPGVGYFQVDNFDPGDWRPNIVNPAFENRTPRDGYWGSKLVMSFTDEQLEAAVRAGRYSDPAAVAYLLEGLVERRDATGRHWFRQVSPLDRPRVEGGAVVYDDLWIRHFGGSARYDYRFRWGAADLEERGVATRPRIPLPAPPSSVPDVGDPEAVHARLEVWKVFEDGERAPRPATVWLAFEAGAYRVVGVRY